MYRWYAQFYHPDLSRQADRFRIVRQACRVEDLSDHKSDIASGYTLPVTGPDNVLSSSQGIVGLFLELAFANNADPITIGGVRIRIIDNY